MHRGWLALCSLTLATLCGCAVGNEEAVASNNTPTSDAGHDDASGADDANDPGADASSGNAAGWPVPEGGVCTPATCSGCCLPSQACSDGTQDDACGKSGWPCADCSAQGTQCKANVCIACTPACSGVLCGGSDGCGGVCQSGSGCCTPSCSGVLCGNSDGCSGVCQGGSGCCTPSCAGATCGQSDGCGGTCDGSCPEYEDCSASHTCSCGPNPDFKRINGVCTPSCGKLLDHLGLPNNNGGCCANGCTAGTFGGGPGDAWDCTYCCSSSIPGQTSCS